MQELYNKLKKYSINDAIIIEESDRQYIALKDMYNNIRDKKNYLSFILANAIICFQLSGKGEDYWEEFGSYYINANIEKEEIIEELGSFIKQSKNNKRFVETKLKRLEKLKSFLEEFIGKEEEYYNDMEKLRDSLAKTMKQKKDAKTIVFAVKMFSYGARNMFNKLVYFPENITIPVDSRLINLFEKYKGDYIDINKFYFDLSKLLKIPELHLDAIVWVNYDDLI